MTVMGPRRLWLFTWKKKTEKEGTIKSEKDAKLNFRNIKEDRKGDGGWTDWTYIVCKILKILVLSLELLRFSALLFLLLKEEPQYA